MRCTRPSLSPLTASLGHSSASPCTYYLHSELAHSIWYTHLRTKDGTAGGAVHFFLNNYRFESVWSRPAKMLQALRRYTTVLTPDLSLYADYPLALQPWNTYRSRWYGANCELHL
jgi:hypothetical protein